MKRWNTIATVRISKVTIDWAAIERNTDYDAFFNRIFSLLSGNEH
jgi:hypothetical protein